MILPPLGPRMGEEETFRAEAVIVDLEIAEALIAKLTLQNEALIANAFETYKGNGNPNIPRFGMAMSAITAERNGRAASDSLRKDYLARIAELEMELVTTKDIALAFEEDAGQQRELVAELNVNIEHLNQFGADYCTKIAELEAAYAKLLVQAETMSVLMQCPWKEGCDAQVAWRKQQDEIFNEFWDDNEVNARKAFKEKT
jgi:hypothetical protein